MDEMPYWQRWHESYENKTSSVSHRLEVVQQELGRLILARLGGPTQLKIISICAGQGHDVLGVLEQNPDLNNVQARLVELNKYNADIARQRANASGLKNVEVVEGDAALISAYKGIVPVDIVLACGVFGNISDEDVYHTIDLFPQLCKQGAGIIWTRGRHPGEVDVTSRIRAYFTSHEFTELAFTAPEVETFSVGVNRFEGIPQQIRPAERMFTFIR